MNFKIAFKTWLKHAKKISKAAQEGIIERIHDSETLKQAMEALEDEKNHFEHVDIEVSCYEEYTSEEEFESTKFAKIGKQSTLGRSYFGKSAVVG